jgi:hypothetical protein
MASAIDNRAGNADFAIEGTERRQKGDRIDTERIHKSDERGQKVDRKDTEWGRSGYRFS